MQTAGWHLLPLDPPDETCAIRLGEFLHAQHARDEHDRYPREKRTYLHWKLTRNYVHPGFASAMVESQSGDFVSLCTVTPKRLWARGRELPWAEIGDTFTDDRFQRKGMFAALVNASRERAQKADFPLVYGLPNGQSAPGYLKKLDFAVKPELSLVRHYLPLSSRALSSRPALEGYPALRRLLGHPLAAGASRALAAAVLSKLTPPGPLRIAPIPRFGPAFDDLWQRVRAGLPYGQVRDSRHLCWRYEQNPFSFTTLGAFAGDELAGYVILISLGGAGRGFRHTLLVDWLFDPKRHGVARALLFGAVRHAIEVQRADLISAVATPISPLPLPFARLGFLHEPVDLPVIFHKNPAALTVLADPAPFHMTLSDTDTF